MKLTPDRARRLPPAHVIGAVLLLALGLASCRSTYPLPTTDLSSSRAAVNAAEEAGAAEHAPVEIRRARQKLEQAQAAADGGDTMQAQILTEQALVDARLAEVSSRAARQEASAESMRASNEALREEIERSQRTAGDGG